MSTSCPVCYPERRARLVQAQRRRQGGYSPLPRCEAHAIKLSDVRLPTGPAPGAAVRAR